jgi:hypothetical protein
MFSKSFQQSQTRRQDEKSHLNGDCARCALGEDEPEISRGRHERVLIRGLGLVLQLPVYTAQSDISSNKKKNQCCGSGSGWIRIQLTVLDLNLNLDPYWESGDADPEPEHGN